MSYYDDSLKDRKILVVDDNKSVASLLGEVLSRYGAESVKALSGQAAVEELKAQEFDLVILDVLMDGMDGWDVLAEIEKLQPELRSRTIIMTGDGFRLDTARKIKEFNLPALYKPFNLDTLYALACQTLEVTPKVKLTAA